MGYDWLVPFGAAVADAIIALVVLVRGMPGPITRSTAWLGAMAGLWNLDIFALYYFDNAAAAEWWSRVFRVGVCLGPVALFRFTRLVTESNERIWRLVDLSFHVVAVSLAIIGLFPGTLVRGLEPHRWGFYIEPTQLYTAVATLIVTNLGISIALMWRRYRHPRSARQREQAKLFLIAGGVLVPFLLTNVLAVYVDGLYPLGNLGNVVWLAIIAYAIVRHRFMDVDYVVRKVVSFALAAAVVLVPTALGVVALMQAVGVVAPLLLGSATACAGLTAAVLIPFLQHAIETQLHRALFAHRYDQRLRMRELGAELVHVLDERELVRRLGQTLADVLEVETSAIYLRDDRTRALTRMYPEPGDVLDGPDAAALDAVTEPLLTAELEAAGSRAAPLCLARAWEVVLPLRVNDRLTGLVALGRNRDFHIVSGEDLNLLAGVASAASVALENARLSRELRRSETALERANRLSSIGTLAAGIAHEIRNPLTAVKTFLDLLPQRLDDREFVTGFRDLSLSELRRVTDLINDLLAFGKSTSAERRPVDLGSTIDQVLRLLDSTARKRQVELDLQVAPALGAAWADPDQVKQIVLNLVLNALEASPPKSIVSVNVVAGSAGRVAMEVHDRGPGIPGDHLESIFDPFFTTKEQGTGLGLSLVHQMVVEHGGDISVDSVVGRGTTFRVELPMVDVALRPTGT